MRPRNWLMMTVAFVGFIVYGSLVPLEYKPVSFDEGLDRWRTAMAKVPEFGSRADWAANILLFIPLGFLATGTLWLARLPSAMLLTLLLIPAFASFSASIELMQVWFPARVTSINDVVAETVGGAIGIVAWFVVGRAFLQYGTVVQKHLPPGWAGKLVFPYLALLVVVQGMPFDLTISPAEIYQKYKRGQIGPMPTSEHDPIEVVKKALIALVYFAPAGILLGCMPGRRWQSIDALMRVALVGFGLAFAIELMQVIIISRNSELLDVAIGGMGVVAGWYGTTHGVRIAGIRAGRRILLGIVLGGLAVLNWAPLDFNFDPGFLQKRLEEVSLVPFGDYYAGNYLLSFERMLQKLLVFVPLGLLLGRYGRTITGIAGFAVAVVLEAGQLASVRHTPGLSDIILETLGTLAGAILWKQIVEWGPLPTAKKPAENRL